MPDDTRYLDADGQPLPAEAAEAITDPNRMRELLDEPQDYGITLRSTPAPLGKYGISAKQQRLFFTALRDGLHEATACEVAGIPYEAYAKARSNCELFHRMIGAHKGSTLQRLQQSLMKLATGQAVEVTETEGETEKGSFRSTKRRQLAPDAKALQMLLRALGAPGFIQQSGPQRVEITFNMGTHKFPERGKEFDLSLLPANGDRNIPAIDVDAEVS